MANKKIIQIVEIPCKTIWKSSCKYREEKCVKLSSVNKICAKNNLFTNFYNIIHQLFNSIPTTIFKLIFPLFHNPYYNNYKIFK